MIRKILKYVCYSKTAYMNLTPAILGVDCTAAYWNLGSSSNSTQSHNIAFPNITGKLKLINKAKVFSASVRLFNFRLNPLFAVSSYPRTPRNSRLDSSCPSNCITNVCIVYIHAHHKHIHQNQRYMYR